MPTQADARDYRSGHLTATTTGFQLHVRISTTPKRCGRTIDLSGVPLGQSSNLPCSSVRQTLSVSRGGRVKQSCTRKCNFHLSNIHLMHTYLTPRRHQASMMRVWATGNLMRVNEHLLLSMFLHRYCNPPAACGTMDAIRLHNAWTFNVQRSARCRPG